MEDREKRTNNEGNARECLACAVSAWMEQQEEDGKSQTEMPDPGNDFDELLWKALEEIQGTPFQTAKNLEFTFRIKGYEMFVDRKDKSITRSTVMLSFHRALQQQCQMGFVSGPKKLGTFGASYLYPVFASLGILTPGKKTKAPDSSCFGC